MTTHPSRTIRITSTSRTTSNDAAQAAALWLNRVCLALVLCRSALPSQVAIHVSRTVITKTAAQSRAVLNHAARNRVSFSVLREASSGIS